MYSPVLVVLCGHAVQCGVELGGVGVNTLISLLEGQRDAAAVHVDVDDLHEQFFANRDNLVCQIHVAHSQLGDVNQTLDAVFHADERTEGNKLGDLAGNDLADGVGPGEGLPRVLLSRLERQGDALAVEVDVQDLDRDLVANLDDLGGVVDVLPGQLGDVDQTVNATQVHEGPEVDDGGHDAGADLPLLQSLQEVGADLGLGLLEPGATGEDHVVAVLVQLNDLRLELAAHVGLEVANATHLHQGGGQEAAQADVQDETALDDLNDGAGDDAVLLLDALDGAPGALVLRALLAQEQTPFLVLLLQDEGFDLVADGDDLVGVDVVLDGQLASEDDAFGLVADVEEDLITSTLTTVPSTISPSSKYLMVSSTAARISSVEPMSLTATGAGLGVVVVIEWMLRMRIVGSG